MSARFDITAHNAALHASGKMKYAKTNALAFAKMVGALLDGPCTVEELAETSGLAASTIREHIFAMRRERVLHIAAWEPDRRGRTQRMVYGLGRRADARKPPPKSGAARQQACRDRKLARVDAVLHGVAP